jgi:hypothetical protein
MLKCKYKDVKYKKRVSIECEYKNIKNGVRP